MKSFFFLIHSRFPVMLVLGLLGIAAQFSEAVNLNAI